MAQAKDDLTGSDLSGKAASRKGHDEDQLDARDVRFARGFEMGDLSSGLGDHSRSTSETNPCGD